MINLTIEQVEEVLKDNPKASGEIKLGNLKALNSIIGVVVKEKPNVNINQFRKDVFGILGVTEVAKEKPSLVKPEAEKITKLIPFTDIHKNQNGELCMETKYQIDGKLYSIWKLSDEDLANPKVEAVYLICKSQLVKT